jgi:hypothetical protein
MKDKRRLGCIGLCASSLALLYCLMGILMAGWLSATPNFPRERTERNLLLWGTLTVVSLVLVCVFIFIFYRSGKKRD